MTDWLTDSCKLTPSHRLLLIQNTVIKIHKKKRTLPPAEAEAEAEAEGAMEQQALIGALNLVSRNLPLPPELFNTVSSIYHGSDTKPLPVDSSVPSLSPPPHLVDCAASLFLSHAFCYSSHRPMQQGILVPHKKVCWQTFKMHCRSNVLIVPPVSN